MDCMSSIHYEENHMLIRFESKWSGQFMLYRDISNNGQTPVAEIKQNMPRDHEICK